MSNIKKSPQAVPEISHSQELDEQTIPKHNACSHGYLQCRQLWRKRRDGEEKRRITAYDATTGGRCEENNGEESKCRVKEKKHRRQLGRRVKRVFVGMLWWSRLLRGTSGVKQD